MFDKYWDVLAEDMSLTLVFFYSEQMDFCELCENPFIDFYQRGQMWPLLGEGKSKGRVLEDLLVGRAAALLA